MNCEGALVTRIKKIAPNDRQRRERLRSRD
jgi:hypothetical protein